MSLSSILYRVNNVNSELSNNSNNIMKKFSHIGNDYCSQSVLTVANKYQLESSRVCQANSIYQQKLEEIRRERERQLERERERVRER